LRVTKAITIYAVVVVALSALLAPWAFKPFHAWEVQRWQSQHPTADSIHAPRFGRVFDRVLLVIAGVGLWPLLRRLGIHSWGEIGYPRAKNWWRHVGLGFLLGIGSLAVAGGMAILLGTTTLEMGIREGAYLVQLRNFAVTAVMVALIEETFFRGAVQGALQRAMNPLVALVLTSAIYSAVHFLKPPSADIPAEAVGWTSGFDHLGRVFSQFWRVPGVGLGFITLWLAGSILGHAFTETKGLYFPIGLHAGWVLAFKSYASWGGGNLTESVMTWPVLLILLAGVNWICRHKLEPLR